MKGTALKPDFFMANMRSVIADKVAEKKGATEEERQLYAMSNGTGWKVLREYIDSEVERIDRLQSEAIAGGMSMNQVGYNAIVIDQVKKIVKNIVDKVEDAKESCERPKGST